MKKIIDAQTEVELNIPELTLAKIVQLGRHETVYTGSEHFSPRVACLIHVRGSFLPTLFSSNTILVEL